MNWFCGALWRCNGMGRFVAITLGICVALLPGHVSAQDSNCPALRSPTDGSVIHSVYLGSGWIAAFTCDPGYELLGSTTLTCFSPAGWGGSVPTCQLIIDCGSLNLPANMNQVAYSAGTVFGSTASYTCITGYEIDGLETRSCQEDATWSGAAPSCVKKDCGSLPRPVNGNRVAYSAGTVFGSSAFYTCIASYRIDGLRTRSCQEDATWSGAAPICVKIDCGSLTPPGNGNRVAYSAGTVFGSTASYTCITGYEIDGLETRSCQEDATWSGAAPSCVKKDCGSLTPPGNGNRVAYSAGTVFGSTASYTCITGYEIDGLETRSCQEDATWSGAAPSCVKKDCGNPTPTFGSIGSSVFTFGSSVRVSCDAGYDVSGAALITCTQDGTWSDDTTCEPKDCGDPTPTFGSIGSSVFTFGSSVRVSCDAGYDVSGAALITCTQDSTWSDDTTCEIKDCGDHTPTFGSIGSSVFTFGSSVRLSCDAGYDVSGAALITCTQDGTWSDDTTCEIKDCGDPTPTFGSIGSSVFTFGSSVRVSCDAGYDVSGAALITCTQDGTWSDDTSCEIKDCGDPTPTFGSIGSSVFTFGSSVRVSCDAGYDVSGAALITCTQDGTWSDDTTCEIKDCGDPTPTFGYIGSSVFTFGSSVRVSCDAGYDVSGAALITCTQDGTWSDDTSCEIKDCGDPTTTFGSIGSSVFTFGSSVRVSCDAGYDVSGAALITCTQDGTWSEDTTCEIKDCGDPTPTFGSIGSSVFTFGSSVRVSCDAGYDVSGAALITCTQDGTWSDDTSCEIKDCGDPTPTFGYIGSSVFTFGSSVRVSCDAGYDVSGAALITCTQDGTWSDDTTCEIKDCGDPTPTFGYIGSSVFTFGSSVRVSCDAGYDVSGAALITCTQDGTWSDDTTCEIKDCGDPTPTFGSIGSSVFTFGSSVRVSCDAGYDVSGAALITCTQDGTWSDDTTCEIKDCGDPTPTFGSVSDPVFTYGSSVSVRCDTGYNVIGATIITCLEDSTWSGNTSCNPIDCSGLSAPADGSIDVSDGTAVGDTARSSCDIGFKLYGGTERTCLLGGEWSGVPATCLHERQPVTPCSTVTDDRQTMWSEALPNQVRVEMCPTGFAGSATRKCNAVGLWEHPQYNCERDDVRHIKVMASELSLSSSRADVQGVLQNLVAITTDTNAGDVEADARLTHAELKALSTSFQDITDALTDDKLDVAVANDIFEAASQMIDSPNKSTWKTLRDLRSTGAERVIKAVDTVTDLLLEQFKSSPNASKAIVKNNIVVEIQKVSDADLTLLDIAKHHDAWQNVTAAAFLSNSAIQGSDVVSIGVIFRDMSEITTTQQSSANAVHKEINGPVVSLKLSQPPCRLVPPLRLSFQHSLTGFSKPSCSFLVNSSKWSSSGCTVVSSNATMTVCECEHLTNFAVLMSPFVEADSESKALRIASIAGIGVSIVCIILTMAVHFHLWRYLRSDRTTMLMHLCVALLVAYTIFLAGVDRTESRGFCAALAVLMHYIFLVVFCLMLAEGVAIAILVLFVFSTKSRISLLLTFAWVLPAVIVGISMGVTKMEGFGNGKFCWLSMDSGLIWAFVGPALAVILFNMICLGVIIKVMFSTKAMVQKKNIDKVKAGVRSLGVLVPLMGVTWVIGIFYINDDLYWMQYVFAVCNGLQGFFIFLFHCLLNQQVRNALAAKKRRQESTSLKSTSAQKYQAHFPGIRMTADTFASNQCDDLPDTSFVLQPQHATNIY